VVNELAVPSPQLVRKNAKKKRTKIGAKSFFILDLLLLFLS
jgi:hypothetical protein